MCQRLRKDKNITIKQNLGGFLSIYMKDTQINRNSDPPTGIRAYDNC